MGARLLADTRLSPLGPQFPAARQRVLPGLRKPAQRHAPKPVKMPALQKGKSLDKWMGAALEYLPQWIDHQMRLTEQPGCSLAVAHKGKLVFEAAFGHAHLGKQVPMTTRHRFRVASHSKTFTAAAIMKLREQGRLKL